MAGDAGFSWRRPAGNGFGIPGRFARQHRMIFNFQGWVAADHRDPAFPWRRWGQQQMEQGWLDSGGIAPFLP